MHTIDTLHSAAMRCPAVALSILIIISTFHAATFRVLLDGRGLSNVENKKDQSGRKQERKKRNSSQKPKQQEHMLLIQTHAHTHSRVDHSNNNKNKHKENNKN